MRTAKGTMLWALLVVLCLMARPTVGRQGEAVRSSGAFGLKVDKNSVGGVLNSNGAKLETGVWVIAKTKSLYMRGLDGRIDDEKAGWKGRGIWATYSSYLLKFVETRIGSVNHIQLRPNPLGN